MIRNPSETSNLPQDLSPASQLEIERMRLAEAFADLYDLLGRYAPLWYTRELQERAESVLQQLRKT
jgi:hypothetical protein